MKKYHVNLADLIPRGQVECELRNNMLNMINKRSIPTQRFDAEHLAINSYVGLPDKYKLPLRIDVTAKIDAPGMYVLIGNGHFILARYGLITGVLMILQFQTG